MEKTESSVSGATPVTVVAEPVVQPASSASTASPNVVYVEKKSGGGAGKCILIGCVVLLLCCCITVVTAFVAPQALVGVIMGQNKERDNSLTRLSSTSEIAALVDTVNQKEGTLTPNNTVILTLSEKELLALIVDGSGLNTTPDKVGVKVTPGDLKMDMEIATLIKAMNESSTDGSSQIDVGNALDGIYVSVQLGTTADSKNLTIKSFSTGNGFIDSLIPADFKKQMETSLQGWLAESTSGDISSDVVIESIKFGQGEVSIELSEATSTPMDMPFETP